MNDVALARALRTLRRAVLMLQTECAMAAWMKRWSPSWTRRWSVASPAIRVPRKLVKQVDALRESMLTPRAELLSATVRACEKLKDGIEEVVSRL